MNQKKINLGHEYDRQLFEALGDALREKGAALHSDSWGVGGSQEISTWDLTVDGEAVRVEAETYIGLTIEGPSACVDALAAAVNAKLGR